MSETKRCTRCGEEKSTDDFNLDKGRKDGREVYCKACKAERYRVLAGSRGIPPKRKPPAPEGRKECPACGETKTVSEFARNKRTWDGLRSECKSCHNARSRVHREAIKGRLPEPVEGQVCTMCNEFKSASEFTVSTMTKDGLGSRCKTCKAAHSREYRISNRETVNARARAIRNKERRSAANRKWASSNIESVRANTNRRRARRIAAEGHYTAADVERLYKAQKGKCYYCGVKVGKTYHVDHVIPLSRGGSNWPENLVIACPPCNTSKNDRLPHEWAKGGRLL